MMWIVRATNETRKDPMGVLGAASIADRFAAYENSLANQLVIDQIISLA